MKASQFFKTSPMFDSVEIVREPRPVAVVAGAIREAVSQKASHERIAVLLDELESAIFREQMTAKAKGDSKWRERI